MRSPPRPSIVKALDFTMIGLHQVFQPQDAHNTHVTILNRNLPVAGLQRFHKSFVQSLIHADANRREAKIPTTIRSSMALSKRISRNAGNERIPDNGFGDVKKLGVQNSDVERGKSGGYRLITLVDSGRKKPAFCAFIPSRT